MVDRRLTLRRELLTELTSDELTEVVGGSPNTKSCPDHTYYCVTGPAICDRLTQSRICP